MTSRPGTLRRLLRNAVLVCAAVDLLLIFIYLSPWVPSHAEANEPVSRASVELELLRTRVSNLQLLQKHIAQSEREARVLTGDTMPAESTVFSDVLAELNRLAQHSRVRATGINFQKAKTTTAGLRQILIAANVEGPYGDVVEFLNAVERSPIFFIVNEISLSNSATESGPGSIRLDVRMETYARTNPETVSGT